MVLTDFVTQETLDLTDPDVQERLFLEEKTAKLEGAVITESIATGALMGAGIPPDQLVQHVWFGQRYTDYHTFMLLGERTTPAQASVLRWLSQHFQIRGVRHGRDSLMAARLERSPHGTLVWQGSNLLAKHLRQMVGRKPAELDDSCHEVHRGRAMRTLELLQERGRVEPFLLERCLAQRWLSRFYGFTPEDEYVPLVYDVDLFIPGREAPVAVEVKQKNPMAGRPLRVGLNRGETKLLATIKEHGGRIILLYLLKVGQEPAFSLLTSDSVRGSSCWIAADIDPHDLLQTGQEVDSGEHTSLGGGTTAPSLVLPIEEHFCLLSPVEGDSLSIDPARWTAFIAGALPLVAAEELETFRQRRSAP